MKSGLLKPGRVSPLLLILPALLWMGGCGKKSPEAPEGRAAAGQHDHDHADGHDHDHADKDGGHEHGHVRHELGEQAVGGWKVSAQQADDVTPGGETVFYVEITGGPKPGGVRLWVGDAQASKSTRALAEAVSETRSHAHVEIPASLGASDMFWVEIDNGRQQVVSVPFKLAEGAVLPPQGPRTGFVAPLAGPSGMTGFAELKLHDDKGDLELWLAKDAAMSQPLDLPLDSVVTAEFSAKGMTVELRVRNADKNEDEDGNANNRGGATNYFIFPGATGADSSWLKGDFRSPVKLSFKSADGQWNAGPFILVPHTHGPGGHSH